MSIWYKDPLKPPRDTEVIAEVKGFKHSKYIIAKYDGEFWWQHIPKVFDAMEADGWIGIEPLKIVRWKYI